MSDADFGGGGGAVSDVPKMVVPAVLDVVGKGGVVLGLDPFGERAFDAAPGEVT